jgi:hypothetical protein
MLKKKVLVYACLADMIYVISSADIVAVNQKR